MKGRKETRRDELAQFPEEIFQQRKQFKEVIIMPSSKRKPKSNTENIQPQGSGSENRARGVGWGSAKPPSIVTIKTAGVG